MKSTVRLYTSFAFGSLRIITSGNRYYWGWMLVLLTFIGFGAAAYVSQLQDGLITTSMRDQVSWGFYIGNFTFLVGVAEAAVTLVIPAYFYNWRPIKEIVAYGILLAVAAIICCTLFVMVDIGRPERFWHLLPGFGGRLNLPSSLLAWDVIALNGYVLLNFGIVTYLLFTMFRKAEPNNRLFMFMVWFSIPAAIAIHMVTAFLYSGLIARPYWNTAILAPRFIASAFCAGPAILLVALQLLRRFTSFHIRREAIWKIAELMAYFMGINLFLLSAEIFQEYYGGQDHVVHLHYMFSGVDGHNAIVPWMWTAVICSVLAFGIFLSRRLRENPYTLNIGCALIFLGVYLEKSMGMVIPGMTPDPLGEIFEYVPSWNEIIISIGILAIGAMLFTLMVKIANQILHGQFNVDQKPTV
ncbi:MAG: polysulfide reductase NrfD [Planctomycetes bacterium]|nr:polysulfide reductase NrfD [Planctomycetota bacterium]